MRSILQAFHHRRVAATMVAFLLLLLSDRLCQAQVRARVVCAPTPGGKTSIVEIERSLSCIDREFRSVRNDMTAFRDGIGALKDEINLLKHVVIYGSVHEGVPLQLLKPTPCEKLNISVVIDRPGLWLLAISSG